MTFPIRCECGQVQRVGAAAAGSRLPCSCGREVAVPSLTRLKAAAGQTALSPEVRIDQMLHLGMLPEETRCLGCDIPTKNTFYFWAICERVEVQAASKRGWWAMIVFAFIIGWFVSIVTMYFYLMWRGDGDIEHGRDVRFRLPLRLCPECAAKMHDAPALAAMVEDVPLYAELLEKYPQTVLALDAEQKGVSLS